MKPLKVMGVSCVAAGLVSTWDATPAQAGPYTFTGQITPANNLFDVYFLFAIGSCSPGGGTFAQKISDFIPANATYSFNLTFNSVPDGLDYGYGYAIAGLYDTNNGGVSLSYSPGWAAATLAVSPAPEWNGYWLPIGGSIMSFAYETDVAAALSSGTNNGVAMNDARSGGPFSPLGTPFPGYSTDLSAPSDFTLVNFSGAAFGGSGFVVEVVPEPSTISLLAAGIGLLSFGFFRPRKVD
jgi:hypothetical protein